MAPKSSVIEKISVTIGRVNGFQYVLKQKKTCFFRLIKYM
jgi:hypothetical protein